MKRVCIYIVLFAGMIPLLQSCSLFKISADFGMLPMPQKELNARVAVRMYASNFTDVVAAAADTVFVRSGANKKISGPERDSVRMASIRWKRNATSACMNTSLNSIPEGAIVNTWVLVKGMAEIDWSKVLKSYGSVADTTSGELLGRYRTVIADFLGHSKLNRMAGFVDSVLMAAPLDMQFEVKDYTYEWLKYSGVPDSMFVKTVGSISQVIADLNDRIGKYSVNVSNQMSWGAEQLEYKWGMSMADSTYKAGLDSLNHSLTMLKSAFRSAPDKIDSLVIDITARVDKMIKTADFAFNSSMNQTFAQLAVEREALQEYVTKERAAIMADGKVMIDDSVQKAMDTASKLIRNLLIYFIIFVFLLIGVPFYIGYKIGHRKSTKTPHNE